MKIINDCLSKHISLSINKDVKEICRSFFQDKNINIDHLNYIQKNNDGTVFYLCSNHDWLRYYYSQSYPSIGAFEQDDSLSNQKYILWSSLNCDDKILYDSKEIISIEHGITIIKKVNNGRAYFNIGNVGSSTTIINTYINNLELLNEFVQYFLDKATPLFKLSEKNRFILPNPENKNLIIYDRKGDLDKIKNVNKLTRLYLDEEKKHYLSPSELNCVYWYLKGKNSAEISEIAHISKRTVEAHISNTKEKLQCRNMMQIGYLIASIKLKNFGFIPDPYRV